MIISKVKTKNIKPSAGQKKEEKKTKPINFHATHAKEIINAGVPNKEMYGKNKKGGKKEEKKSFVFVLLLFLTFSLAIATMVYFYNVSQKITQKRQNIISLYNKIEKIKNIHIKSQIMLRTLSHLDENQEKGTVYFLVDADGVLQKQADAMLTNFMESKVIDYKKSNLRDSNIVVLALFGLILFVLIRLILLSREKKTALFDFAEKQKEAKLRENETENPVHNTIVLQLQDFSK